MSSDHLLSSDFKSPTVKIGTGSMTDDPFSHGSMRGGTDCRIIHSIDQDIRGSSAIGNGDVVCGNPSCRKRLQGGQNCVSGATKKTKNPLSHRAKTGAVALDLSSLPACGRQFRRPAHPCCDGRKKWSTFSVPPGGGRLQRNQVRWGEVS